MQGLILIAERLEHKCGGGTGNTVATLAIIGVVVVAILGRFITHGMDRSRIEKYAGEQGWELRSCQWKLLRPGWFDNSRERIHSITSRGGQGHAHSAFAKTSVLAGVYLTEDRVEG